MKKKTIISMVIAVLIAVICGVLFYHEQTTVPQVFAGKTLTSDQVDNNLSNWFDLRFTKNHAILVAKNGGNKNVKMSQLNKEILAAFSVESGDAPSAGNEENLGRVKTTQIKNGYRIQTRKVTFVFTKDSDGAYRTQDGTIWQFSPAK